jgi:hypothetical protein
MGSVHNPQEVSIGAAELSDVLSIEWRMSRPEIVSPPGDGEMFACHAGYRSVPLRGKLVFADPAQAAAAAGLFGTLIATLKGVGGGPDRTLTITNAKTGGSENLVGHNRAATSSVEFLAVSSDGATSPVTLT